MTKLFSYFYLMTSFLFTTSLGAMTGAVYAAPAVNKCEQTQNVCVDGPSTKVINGVSVRKDCWEWKKQFTCLEPNVADYCRPLKDTSSQCEVGGQKCIENDKNGVCLKYEHIYSCGIDIKKKNNGKLPEKIIELEPTHLITSSWDESQCTLAGMNGCEVVEEVCVEGPETREINGVSVTRDCWKVERKMRCNLAEDKSECEAFEKEPKCTLKSEQCTSKYPDGRCQVNEKVYQCVEHEGGTTEVSTCVDQDFAKTMTSMEMAREMQRYYDPDAQRFFEGDANKCSIKLGGAVNGILGGHCCKTKADPSTMQDWAVQAGTQVAVQNLLASTGSHYTYSMLMEKAPQFLINSVAAAEGLAGTATGGLASGGVGAFGFAVTTTAPAAGAGATVVGSSGGLYLTFDPVSFGIAIAVMALQQYLSCAQSEIMTAMKTKAGLCEYVGSYCSSKVMGACVKRVEAHCCYISKLAKIVNIEGRKQIQKSWGSAENPICEGFTAQELEQLDFSKMDMSEFYAEIYANMEGIQKQTENARKQAEENIKKGQQEYKGTYYE